MHICLPDTREVKPAHGSAYLLYNVHIDGLYHCSLRYKQFLHLHQALAKELAASSSGATNNHGSPFHQCQLPQFPPKKLLPLTLAQTEERRQLLEKYLQTISQDKVICNSLIFNSFLLEAQRESTRIRENQVHLDIELVNGHKIRLQIYTHDSADAILTSVCRALGLDEKYHAYFCLCLCGYDVVRDKLIIKRRLSYFESPYVTLQMAIQQQEQLQSVLGSHHYSPPTDTNCRCMSCLTRHPGQQLHNQPAAGSSSRVSSMMSDENVAILQSDDNAHQSRGSLNAVHHQHQQYSVASNRASHQNGLKGNQQQQHQVASAASYFVTHRILLRISYWDPIYDTHILNDSQALNLLFIQTVYDIKHSLMFVDRDTYHQLESLMVSNSMMDYILLARTLKYYNYVHFEPCFSDYPRPRTKVMISIGSKELNMRVLRSPQACTSSSAPTSGSSASSSSSPSSSSSSSSSTSSCSSSSQKSLNNTQRQQNNGNINNHHHQQLYCTSSLVPNGYHNLMTNNDLVEEEYTFKVPLIRCWRLTSLETLNAQNDYDKPSAANNKSRTPSKSVSFFNSVLGKCNATNGRDRKVESMNGSGNEGNLLNAGYGGSSLLSALSGSSGYRNTQSSHLGQQSSNGEESSFKGAQQVSVEHPQQQFSQYELSFEYLFSKDTLKWITISSDQAIFISISLQGVVDELVSKRCGRPTMYKSSPLTERILSTTSGSTSNNGGTLKSSTCFTYMYRDGTRKQLKTLNQRSAEKFKQVVSSPMSSSNNNGTNYALSFGQPRQQVVVPAENGGVRSSPLNFISSTSSRFSSMLASSFDQSFNQTSFEISNFKKDPSPIINDAFEGVTNDDDL